MPDPCTPACGISIVQRIDIFEISNVCIIYRVGKGIRYEVDYSRGAWNGFTWYVKFHVGQGTKGVNGIDATDVGC
jgi:hypothetical protein